MMKIGLPLCASLLAFAQVQADEAKPKPTGIYYNYAVFFTPAPKAEPAKAAAEIHAGKFAERFSIVGKEPKLPKGNHVAFREVALKDYPPPPATYLESKGFGLAPEQREALAKSEKVLLVAFFVVQPENYSYLIPSNELVAEIAEATGGLIWDEETREMFGTQSWRQRRLPTDHAYQVLANTTLHIVEQPNKAYRAITLGMRKMGQPDLEVADFPQAFTNPVMALLKFLVEEVSKPGPLNPKISWTGEEMRQLLGLPKDAPSPDIKFAVGAPKEGDPRNDVLTLDPRDLPGKDYPAKLAGLIDAYFRPDDAVLALHEQRETLMKLSEKARETLKTKKAAFAESAPVGEQLRVKAYIDGEYLWVQVDKWPKEDLEGRLLQAPAKTKEKKQGDAVTVKLDQVLDYAHIKVDGAVEGDETTKFIRQLAAKTAQETKKPQAPKAR